MFPSGTLRDTLQPAQKDGVPSESRCTCRDERIQFLQERRERTLCRWCGHQSLRCPYYVLICPQGVPVQSRKEDCHKIRGLFLPRSTSHRDGIAEAGNWTLAYGVLLELGYREDGITYCEGYAPGYKQVENGLTNSFHSVFILILSRTSFMPSPRFTQSPPGINSRSETEWLYL